MPVRLLYFSCNDIGREHANSIQIVKNCEAFARAGIPTRLYYNAAGKWPGRYTAAFESERVAPATWFRWMGNALFSAFRLLRRKNGSKERCILYSRNFYFCFLACLAKHSTVIFEAHTHNIPPWYNTLLFSAILRFFSLKPNVGVVAISDSLRRSLLETGYRRHILVAHDGFDPHDGHKADPEMVERIDEKKAGYHTIALYSGSFSKAKGVDYLLLLAQRNRDTLFLLVGNPDSNDAPHTMAALHSCSNVLFLGFVAHQQVAALQRIADILLLVPHRDGSYNDYTSPMKLFEYMAAGRAIFATWTPSLAEVVRNGENAVVAEQNVPDILGRFADVKQNVALRERIGACARRESQQFTWDRRVAKILRFSRF